ncbi:MAG: GGDEF domain-containing protein [Pseudomonadota bacterium]
MTHFSTAQQTPFSPTHAALAPSEMSHDASAQSHDLHTQLITAQARLQAQAQRIKTLEQLVYVDDLTGLLNRRAFDNLMIKELDRCRRGLSQGGLLVMIDLDNFKAINDSFGHHAGDTCLRVFADTLASNARAMDSTVRLGGDEFAILMGNTDTNTALHRIQQLAWDLNHVNFMWQGYTIAMRASVGVREFTGRETPDSILADADASLYSCKSSRADAPAGAAASAMA